MTVIFGSSAHLTLIQIVGVSVFVFSMWLSTVDVSEVEKLLAQAVVDALHASRLTVKEAASWMRMDESQLRHQLRAEPQQHLSLTKMIRLPLEFWLAFTPTLMWLVAKKRINEIAEEVRTIAKRA